MNRMISARNGVRKNIEYISEEKLCTFQGAWTVFGGMRDRGVFRWRDARSAVFWRRDAGWEKFGGIRDTGVFRWRDAGSVSFIWRDAG